MIGVRNKNPVAGFTERQVWVEMTTSVVVTVSSMIMKLVNVKKQNKNEAGVWLLVGCNVAHKLQLKSQCAVKQDGSQEVTEEKKEGRKKLMPRLQE